LNDRLMIFGLVRRRQDHHGCEVTADPWRIDDDTATAWRRATDLGWRRIGDGPEHEPILPGSTPRAGRPEGGHLAVDPRAGMSVAARRATDLDRRPIGVRLGP
jgi:hypothetical protein